MTIIEIPLVAGPNQNADAAILPHGALSSLHNLRAERLGRIVRRQGYDSWAPLVDVQTYRVAEWRGCQLSFGTGPPPGVGVPTDRWGYMNDVVAEDVITLQSGTPLDNPRVAVGPTSLVTSRVSDSDSIGCAVVGTTLVIGYALSSVFYLDVIDLETNTLLFTESISKSSQAGATVFACKTYIVALYRDAATIKYAILDAGNDARAFTQGTVDGCTNLSEVDIAWDATAIEGEDYFVVAYNDTTATRFTAKLIHIVAGATSATLSDTVAVDAADGIAIAGTSITGPFYCLFGHAVSGALRCTMWDGTLTAGNQKAVITIDVSYDPTDGPFTISTASTVAVAMWSNLAPSTRYCTLDPATPAKGTTYVSRGAMVYSKPRFEHAWLQFYHSDYQRHYRLVRANGSIRQLGKSSFRTAGSRPCLIEFSPIPSISFGSDGVSYVGLGEVTGGSIASSETQRSVSCYKWNYTDERWGSAADLGGLHLAGLGHSMFDGKQLLGDLTPQAPEAEDSWISAVAGSYNQTGTVEYKLVLLTVDTQNNRWRSPPSVTITKTLSSETATIRAYSAASEANSEGSYIELYKRHTNGTFRLAEISAGHNGAAWVDIVDRRTSLSSAELLYTEGDEPESFPTPPSQVCVVYNSRLFFACGKNIYYSHQYTDSHGTKNAPWVVESFVIVLPDDVTGLAPLDNMLIIFTEDGIYYISGDGPNRRGQGTYPTYPAQVSSEVGCVDWRSVVVFRDGVAFRSRRGIELLPRGSYAVQPIGNSVKEVIETYTNTTGAVVLEGSNQIRWTMRNDSGGIVLCYDYIYQLWSTESTPASDCSGVWDGSYVVGACRPPTAPYAAFGAWIQGGQWTDDDGDGGSVTYECSLQTGEIRAGGSFGGWGRIRRVNLIGGLRGNATVKLGVAFDGDTSFSDEGSLAWTYSSDAPLRQEYAPARQKCETAKIQVRDSCTTEGYVLHALRFDIKPSEGPARLASSKRG